MIFVSMRVKINNSRRLFFSWSLTSRAYITYPTKYLQNDGIPWVYSPESVRVPKQSPLGLSIRPFEILTGGGVPGIPILKVLTGTGWDNHQQYQ